MTESDWQDEARQIDECANLFLQSIREVEELTLQLTLAEAKPQAPIVATGHEDEIGRILIGSRPIEIDTTCRFWRVIFDRRHMVSYTVLNESYGTYPEEPERFTGKLFRAFSSSHLLEFTRRTTCASDEYPGPLHHYQIVCANHVIDVICTAHPTINPLTS